MAIVVPIRKTHSLEEAWVVVQMMCDLLRLVAGRVVVVVDAYALTTVQKVWIWSQKCGRLGDPILQRPRDPGRATNTRISQSLIAKELMTRTSFWGPTGYANIKEVGSRGSQVQPVGRP